MQIHSQTGICQATWMLTVVYGELYKLHTYIHTYTHIHCVSKKTAQICFCQNFVKFPSILIIFGRKMAKRLKLYEMHSFSTSPNLRHHTTVLNADVPNCYRTLKVDICNKLSNDLERLSNLAHNKLKRGLFSRIISSYNSSAQNCQKLSEFVYELPKN